MAKQMLKSSEARKEIIKGLNKLADIVEVTQGPKGRNVLIEKEWGEAVCTQDGVTVARSVLLKNKFENMGAQAGTNASIKTNDETGDATTATIGLARAMTSEGEKYSELGISALGIRKGMKKATNALTKELGEMTIEIKDKNQIKQIATIAAKDEEIGTIVSDIMDKVGKAGVVNVEKGQTNIIEQEIVEGFRFDKGFVSPYMATDRDKGIAEFNEPYILITDKAITDVNTLLPIMEKLVKLPQGAIKQLAIICGDIGGDALMTLVVNNANGSYRGLAIKAPYYGDKQKATLEDIAILTGGKLITQDINLELKNIKIEDLGQAKKIIVTKDTTTIIEGKGDKDLVVDRIVDIEKQEKAEKSDFLKEILRERLGRLSGVVGVIKVGANSEIEQKDLELRIEDAISAAQAALEEGIVIGGGLALIKARHSALANKQTFTSDEEEKGWEIVMKAVERPFYQILINAGEKPDVILDKIQNDKNSNLGFNADTGKYVDMFKEGITDSTKSIRCALKNACSTAEMILATEGVICLEEVDTQKPTVTM